MAQISRFACVGLIVFGFAAVDSARAQCWQPGFELSGTDDQVYALTGYDDGSGPAVFAAGEFRTAGAVDASNIAKWDGSAWSPLGTGLGNPGQGFVFALLAFDDGSGPALYAAGSFLSAGAVPAHRIAKWNGSTWQALGTGFDDIVSALAIFDDGSGPALYAGGTFAVAGGVLAHNIAKWNGSSWSAVGSGIGVNGYSFVDALAVFDDGSGPALFAAGHFGIAGGVAANGIAKWDGSHWSPLAEGTNISIARLATFDDGSGPALYAGGPFTSAGGAPANHIAKWNGTSWAALPGGSVDLVGDLAVFDDGSGPALHLAGTVSLTGGGSTALAKWNGSDWTPVPGGLSRSTELVARALAVVDDGSGAALYCGGSFSAAGGHVVRNVARWSGTDWSALGGGAGLESGPLALVVHDDGTGPSLFAGGDFSQAGDQLANCIAKWNGSTWSPLSTGMEAAVSTPTVRALAEFDDGAGLALYAAGSFTSAGGVAANHVARWNGSQWSPLGSGVNQPASPLVSALAVFDDGAGPALYMAGRFTQVGGVAASCIARWDGAGWTPLATGMSDSVTHDPDVTSLAVFDDGSGPALFAAGSFSHAGGVPVSNVAKWDGVGWFAVGGGTDQQVACLTIMDDGSGAALYAGGSFTHAGGASCLRVAKWNGAAWSALGSGIGYPEYPAELDALSAFDDGTGPALYAGGQFSNAGGQHLEAFARWNGSQWSAVGSGLAGPPSAPLVVRALCAYDPGARPALYVAGNIRTAGGQHSESIAAWGTCSGDGTGQSFCFGDDASGGCPCGNTGGFAGHGCANSLLGYGAILTGSGRASLAADTVLFVSTYELPTALSIVLQGDVALAAPVFFGDGKRCAGGALKRLYVKSANAGIVVAPVGADLSVSARSAALGDPIHAAEFRIYQVYYRDPSPSFCPSPPGGTFNASQALRIVWEP